MHAPPQTIPARPESRSAADRGRPATARGSVERDHRLPAARLHSFAPGAATPVIQCGGSAIRHPKTPQELHITYTNGFDRDLIDNMLAWNKLAADFETAADQRGLTDAMLAANRTYERAFNVPSALFEYSCYWDRAKARLMVQSTHYTGHGAPPALMVPGAALRQKVARMVGVHDADLPSIDWLSKNMQWNVADVAIKASSGDVITFVPADSPFVVQYYKSPEMFTRTKTQLEKLAGRGAPGVAAAVPLDAGLRLLKVESLYTLNSLSKDVPVAAPTGAAAASTATPLATASATGPASASGSVASGKNPTPALAPRFAHVAENARQIFTETRTAILALHKKGVSQGDVSIDNLGLKDKHYTLFDFNMSETSSDETVMRDLKNLIKSIEFNGGKVPDEYKKNPLAKGSWG